MRAPQVRVVLGDPQQAGTDLVVLPGTRARDDGRVVTVVAPRWKQPDGPRHLLAEAYREAVAVANARGARSMALPGILARGVWPLDEVTGIALTVLMSTPTTVERVVIAARTPAMVERWAEALIREPH